MPITRPSASTSAPPEFPGEIAASVWTRSMRAGVRPPDGMARWSPETIPAVTLFSKPRGLPRATASSPTRGSASANCAAGRPSRSTSSTARSVRGSVARTSAATRSPVAKAISMPEAPSTTWLFVTTMPPSSQMTPLPCPASVSTATTEGSTSWTTSGIRPKTPPPSWPPAATGAGSVVVTVSASPLPSPEHPAARRPRARSWARKRLTSKRFSPGLAGKLGRRLGSRLLEPAKAVVRERPRQRDEGRRERLAGDVEQELDDDVVEACGDQAEEEVDHDEDQDREHEHAEGGPAVAADELSAASEGVRDAGPLEHDHGHDHEPPRPEDETGHDQEKEPDADSERRQDPCQGEGVQLGLDAGERLAEREVRAAVAHVRDGHDEGSLQPEDACDADEEADEGAHEAEQDDQQEREEGDEDVDDEGDRDQVGEVRLVGVPRLSDHLACPHRGGRVSQAAAAQSP